MRYGNVVRVFGLDLAHEADLLAFFEDARAARQRAETDFRALQIDQDTDGAAGLGFLRAHRGMQLAQHGVAGVAHVDAEDVDAGLEQRADLGGGRGRRAQRGDDLGRAAASHASIREVLFEVELAMGVDLEEAATVEAALGTAALADDGEVLGRCGAEILGAAPQSRGAVGGIHIIVTPGQVARHQLGAVFPRNLPPAPAGPARAVEQADRDLHRMGALVAYAERRAGGTGGGEKQGKG